ncbi:MAG TPA: AMP-binding protein [Microlunatus sp.]|nr:AMP-binding protein [Microlunatus sp.]
MRLNPHVRAARDFLVQHREEYDTAYAGFSWPRLARYNFATDWFDGLAEENPDGTALWIIDADGTETRRTFAQLRDRSRAAARMLAARGLGRGDRLLVVLGNAAPLWEIMLGAIRLGAVIIPATPQLSPADLADRVARGAARLLVAHAADSTKFASVELALGKIAVAAVGEATPDGWGSYAEVDGFAGDDPLPDVATRDDDPLLLYFTSGTTALPKLVEHTATSYPIGHLSTMYWMGLIPGDVHLNISSPGWAKHAWSNFFAPWLAGATVLVYNFTRFDAAGLLEVLRRAQVTTFCAPPTVWRMLIQADLASVQVVIREALSAGEPLNPEVIEQVQRAWGVTIRDGYGQTETSAQVGNSPGARIKLGSMGRPLPGYRVVLVDPATGELRDDEGELCLDLGAAAPGEPAGGRPLPLMTGYKSDADTFDPELNERAFAQDRYHTGDVVSRDDQGYLTYVGRADDVFKASDYRISPFELESVLIEHPAVAEAAVVPAPDPIRLAVPKAYVVLAAGYAPDADTARAILGYARDNLAPYKRVRRIEFAELPKTISGKIRRVELRARERDDPRAHEREFKEADFQW